MTGILQMDSSIVSFFSSTAGAFFPWPLAVTARHNSCCRGGSVRHRAVRHRPRCPTPVAPLPPQDSAQTLTLSVPKNPANINAH